MAVEVMKRVFVTSALLSFVLADTSSLKWPYPLNIDYQEAFLTEGSLLDIIARDCALRSNTTIPAQWVRTAYHDMATANVDTGIGGLDASIRFEQDRAENIGDGMQATLNDFNLAQRAYCSMADLLAIGVVFGYRVCGGPSIPYRAGRVDATEAGTSGVPEPQQTIEEFTESFRKQGFTQQEMISLVACGHTLGGVRSADFPTVQIDPDVDVALFHGEQTYANDIVTEYLDGTTPNPLVKSSNTTMNSDLKVFSSDGNATMQVLSDKETFDKTCSNLLERMINTVPKGVTLTDVITPIENRVSRVRLFPSSTNDGELVLTLAFRLLNPASGLTVRMFWLDRREPATCPTEGCSVDPTKSFGVGVGLKTIWGITTAKEYDFEARIDATASISKFWFELSDGTKVDNGGEGFSIEQDDFLLDPYRSVRIGFFPQKMNVTVAVRTAAGEASNLRMTTWDTNDGQSPEYLPKVRSDINFHPSNVPSVSGYTFYYAPSFEDENVNEFGVQGTVGGIGREIPGIDFSEIHGFVSS